MNKAPVGCGATNESTSIRVWRESQSHAKAKHKNTFKEDELFLMSPRALWHNTLWRIKSSYELDNMALPHLSVTCCALKASHCRWEKIQTLSMDQIWSSLSSIVLKIHCKHTGKKWAPVSTENMKKGSSQSMSSSSRKINKYIYIELDVRFLHKGIGYKKKYKRSAETFRIM